MINLHSHHFDPSAEVVVMQADSDSLVQLAERFPTAYFSIGIHPWNVGSDYEVCLQKLEVFLNKPDFKSRIIALGECGLDKLRNQENFSKQEACFSKQIMLAEKHGLPLLIHCVKAHQECSTLLLKEKVSVPIVFHGWNNRETILAPLLKNGWNVSFGSALLNENSQAGQQIVTIPRDRIFLETDDSELPIEKIYSAAEHLMGISHSELQKIIARNFSKFCRL
ncbi:MAG TPA: TatD family hydrolase [Flavobacteriales bacterium]|nr:TatD family hydrolase [Flavobacteriales bacterium]HRJ36569.1 TatD family hydrolase [Flavobacteriales bacterium]HRJ39004.1 TatD family hydrolase [Flavobacteriales bacterium]